MVPGAGLEPASSSFKARVPTPSELPGACAAPGSGTVTFRVGRVATPGRRARRVATRPTGPRRPPSPSRHLERRRGLEPRTSTVEAWRSGLMSYCRLVVRGPSGVEPWSSGLRVRRSTYLSLTGVELAQVGVPDPRASCANVPPAGVEPATSRASTARSTNPSSEGVTVSGRPGAPAVGAADVPPRPGTSRGMPTLAGWWRQVPPPHEERRGPLPRRPRRDSNSRPPDP
jgi:hypothetical protein